MLGNLYWDEIARMNNRNWNCGSSPNVATRRSPLTPGNTFFLHLAGGCQGINYFTYAEVKPVDWKELGRLGNAVVRPYYPFLGKLRPVQTQNGLLLPYTQYAHTSSYPAEALYAYANLLGTHLDVQPTCEEEVLSGYIRNYKTILLWHVEWMRESVVKALENYIAKGGVVLADSTTIVPIKGAIRLPVDLAMGDKKSKPDVNDLRFGGPGIKDYLHPDRVADIGKAVGKYAQPWADCADSTLVVRRHAYRGVTYLWLVNVHNQEEYEYIRSHNAGLASPWNVPTPRRRRRSCVSTWRRGPRQAFYVARVHPRRQLGGLRCSQGPTRAAGQGRRSPGLHGRHGAAGWNVDRALPGTDRTRGLHHRQADDARPSGRFTRDRKRTRAESRWPARNRWR